MRADRHTLASRRQRAAACLTAGVLTLSALSAQAQSTGEPATGLSSAASLTSTALPAGRQPAAPSSVSLPRPSTQISRDFPPQSRDAFLEVSTYALHADQPNGATLSVFAPQFGYQSRAAVVIAPGGGYIGLAANLEGRQVADWFASRGVTAFVLRYRLGAANPLPVPIEDGERAIRFVRANAAALGIDPNRVAMMGFSAGGHLSAMTTVRSDLGDRDAADPVERVSSRPDALVLGYPGLGSTDIQPDGTSRYCTFARLGGRRDCRPEDYVQYTPFGTLAAKAPPTFIYQTSDDRVVPASEAARLYLELLAAGVDVEAHLFAHGPHGSGLGGADPALSQWPGLLEAWLRARGWLDRRDAEAKR